LRSAAGGRAGSGGTGSAAGRRGFLAATAALAAGAALPARAGAFDHGHRAWTALLARHVVLVDGGNASQLRYDAIAAERPLLADYLAALSSVRPDEFGAFTKPRQMAFLINAYNAFTVELVLTAYPDIRSIKDLGSLFQSPWKRRFVPLLGTRMSLDGIEHDTLRARGRYDDPRIHFAVNCASVGCPMLREEAFVAERLDDQLDEQEARFLSDRSRNRWSAGSGRLEVSRIFDWYAEDFRLGHRGIDSLAGFFARHAGRLADAAADRDRIRDGRARIAFLDYDWSLNDADR
jgi:hypothetical protein